MFGFGSDVCITSSSSLMRSEICITWLSPRTEPNTKRTQTKCRCAACYQIAAYMEQTSLRSLSSLPLSLSSSSLAPHRPLLLLLFFFSSVDCRRRPLDYSPLEPILTTLTRRATRAETKRINVNMNRILLCIKCVCLSVLFRLHDVRTTQPHTRNTI